MNAHDRAVWTKALEKIDAGTPEGLTDDEREVVSYFGNATMLEPRARDVERHLAALVHKSLDGRPLEHGQAIAIRWRSE